MIESLPAVRRCDAPLSRATGLVRKRGVSATKHCGRPEFIDDATIDANSGAVVMQPLPCPTREKRARPLARDARWTRVLPS